MLTKAIYDVTGDGVFGRDFGLRDQIRRASVSVMSTSQKDLIAAVILN